MARLCLIAVLAFMLAGCIKEDASRNLPGDPISRLIAAFTNRQGSFVYASTGAPASAKPEVALSNLTVHGDLTGQGIMNFRTLEIHIVYPEDRALAKMLTNSALVLIATESGRKVIHLRQTSGDWTYHVYDSE